MKRLNLKFASIIMGTFLIGATSCGTLATVTVGPKEKFVLGDVSNKNFSAKVTNASGKEVKISIVDSKTWGQNQGFGLPARQSAKISVSSDETVLFINDSNETVKVRTKLNKSVEGMRYESVE